MRFGNKAFNQWLDKVRQTLVKEVVALSGAGRDAAEEMAVYLIEAFGNETRLDYGTGHELNFLVFLFCMNKIGCTSEKDY